MVKELWLNEYRLVFTLCASPTPRNLTLFYNPDLKVSSLTVCLFGFTGVTRSINTIVTARGSFLPKFTLHRENVNTDLRPGLWDFCTVDEMWKAFLMCDKYPIRPAKRCLLHLSSYPWTRRLINEGL